VYEKSEHGLINCKDTKAKFRHLNKFTCNGTLRQGFIRVYRLEIQSEMLVYSTQLCERYKGNGKRDGEENGREDEEDGKEMDKYTKNELKNEKENEEEKEMENEMKNEKDNEMENEKENEMENENEK